LGAAGKVVSKEALPEEFHCLEPDEIEDCLCHHKDWLRDLAAKRVTPPKPGRGC
jgi:hypothetical protein